MHRLGEVLLMPGISYIVFSIVSNPGSLFSRLKPYPQTFLFIFIVMGLWGLTFFAHRCFYFCETYDWAESKQRNEMTGFVSLNVEKYITFVRIMIFQCWIPLLIAWIAAPKWSAAVFILTGIFTVILVLCIQQAGAIIIIYTFSEDKISYSESGARRQYLAAFIILGSAALAGFAFARGKVLVSVADIAKLIIMIGTWLMYLLNKLGGSEDAPPQETSDTTPLQESPIPEAIEKNPETETNIFLIILIVIVGLVIAFFFLYGLYILIEYIIFRRVQRKTMKKKDVIIKSFKMLAAAVFSFIKDFFRYLFLFKKRKRIMTREYPTVEQIRISARTVKTPEKDEEINEILHMYLKLIRWGVKNGVPWQGLMPLEYNERLIENFPKLADDLENIVNIYEESIFSDHLLEKGVLDKYKMRIKGIIKTRPVNYEL